MLHSACQSSPATADQPEQMQEPSRVRSSPSKLLLLGACSAALPEILLSHGTQPLMLGSAGPHAVSCSRTRPAKAVAAKAVGVPSH